MAEILLGLVGLFVVYKMLTTPSSAVSLPTQLAQIQANTAVEVNAIQAGGNVISNLINSFGDSSTPVNPTAGISPSSLTNLQTGVSDSNLVSFIGNIGSVDIGADTTDDYGD